MIDFTKPVQTRDGRKVRILCTDSKRTQPVIGVIYEDWRDEIYIWSITGEFMPTKGTGHDLINVPDRIEREVWLNIYPVDHLYGILHQSKEAADRNANVLRLACVKIHISYLRGEGLDGLHQQTT